MQRGGSADIVVQGLQPLRCGSKEQSRSRGKLPSVPDEQVYRCTERHTGARQARLWRNVRGVSIRVRWRMHVGSHRGRER